MRTKNSSAVVASSPQAPTRAEELPRFLDDELAKLWNAIQLLSAGHSDVSYAPPDKPRDGDERYADGTVWNPGSGRGKYIYKINTWTFLG
jgi:hypothetical protein